MAGKKKQKSGKSRRAEAMDNIEYATLRSAGELADIQHQLDDLLGMLRDIRDLLKEGSPPR